MKGIWYQIAQELNKFKVDNFVKELRSDENEKMNKSLGLKLDSNLNIGNQNNKIIVPKELKLNIQKVIDKAFTPKCKLKWGIFNENKFNWISIGIHWTRLNVNKALSSPMEIFALHCLFRI